MIKPAAEDAQLFFIGLAPVAFSGEGADVGAFFEAKRIADDGVFGFVVDGVQTCTGVEQFIGRGHQRMVEADGVTVVFPMRLKLQAVVQLHVGARICAIA
ncbi:hypothetical protein D3C72_2191180 [compost metagenome]